MKTMPVTNSTKPRLLRLALLPALAATALLGACGGGGRQAPVLRSSVPVIVGKVVQKTMPVTFRAIGHVEAIATVAIRARIGGELQKVWFAQGQSVAQGATLFTIDPRQYQAALRQAEAQLAKDKALLAKAEADITRYEGLVKQDFVTREQYDQIIDNAAALRAAVAADEASIDNARLQVEYCTIMAPIPGRTGDLMVKAGNLVTANDSKALVTINQTHPIYASFSVPGQLLPELTRNNGSRVTVTASLPQNAGPPEEGMLTFVDNAVDTATGTILLKATFTNKDERLWPGQFVDIVVTLGQEADRIVAPASAVQTGQQGQYVFVVKDDQTVELRVVKVGRIDETEAVIEKGLAAGETVVTDGQLRLVPGAKVEIKSGLGGGEKQG
jgi:multidrug efflux system membrane fusion protein